VFLILNCAYFLKQHQPVDPSNADVLYFLECLNTVYISGLELTSQYFLKKTFNRRWTKSETKKVVI
jgi:hypothetical protein